MADFEALTRITQEAHRLFAHGELTIERLEELEQKAEALAGEWGEWREAFERYRDVLEAFAGEAP